MSQAWPPLVARPPTHACTHQCLHAEALHLVGDLRAQAGARELGVRVLGQVAPRLHVASVAAHVDGRALHLLLLGPSLRRLLGLRHLLRVSLSLRLALHQCLSLGLGLGQCRGVIHWRAILLLPLGGRCLVLRRALLKLLNRGRGGLRGALNTFAGVLGLSVGRRVLCGACVERDDLVDRAVQAGKALARKAVRRLVEPHGEDATARDSE